MSFDELVADVLTNYAVAWQSSDGAKCFGIAMELFNLIEQHVAEAVAKETERLRGALLTLANAADDVGVQFFDMEDPPISVAQMESATLAARAALAALQEAKP